jgi:hypothetical protein
MNDPPYQLTKAAGQLSAQNCPGNGAALDIAVSYKYS